MGAEKGKSIVLREISLFLKELNSAPPHSHQDGEQDPIIVNFNKFKENILHAQDPLDLEKNDFITPFLDVIRSKETTGSVISAALNSVDRFINHGLIGGTGPTVATILEKTAAAVTKLYGDPIYDGVVLIKILQLLRDLMVSPMGVMLSKSTVNKILETFYKIGFTDNGELLREISENHLKDMVQSLFTQLPSSPEDLGEPGLIKISTAGRSPDSMRKVEEDELYLTPDHKDRQDVSQSSSIEKEKLEVEEEEDESFVPLRASTPVPSGDTSREEHSIESEPTVIIQYGDPKYYNNNGERTLDISSQPAETYSELDSTAWSLFIDTEEKLHNDGSGEDKSVDYEQGGDKEIQSALLEANFAIDNSKEPENSLHGGKFKSYEEEKDDVVTNIQNNLAGAQEVFLSFLVSMCNQYKVQNTEVNIHISLKLLIVALEVGADAIASTSTLLGLVKNDLCRSLISLLSSENLTDFTANVNMAYVIFKSFRSHLKFQMEAYLVRLAAVIKGASKIHNEKKEVALESLLQFWRIPAFVTELYVNYDCGQFSGNVVEDLIDLLSKNACPLSDMSNTHISCLRGLLSILNRIEFNSLHGYETETISIDLSGEELFARKQQKELLLSGTELFNTNPSHGIRVLQESGLLASPLDPQEVAHFFRENPMLDKNKIGEYISNKKNLKVLQCFIRCEDYARIRIDKALKVFLETFHLPREAIPISLVLRQFAEHWHKNNTNACENSDAAFNLANAIFILNNELHNTTIKKHSLPMTAKDFMKNLKGLNGGKDFDKKMLESVYSAVRKEEIVLPEDQTGIVRENYLWKVLLRRGASKEGTFLHAPAGLCDEQLFTLIHRPTVAALCLVFDRSDNSFTYELAISGLKKIMIIYNHLNRIIDTNDLFTTFCNFILLPLYSWPLNTLAASFGESLKAQLAFMTIFDLAHCYGDLLRDGWNHILSLIIIPYRCKLLPKELVTAEDFVTPYGRISLMRDGTLHLKERAPAGSLYYFFSQSKDPGNKRYLSLKDEENIAKAKHCIIDCQIERVITESKFLCLQSFQELVKALIYASCIPDSQEKTYDEDTAVFFLEFLLSVVAQNKDRVRDIWQEVRDHLFRILNSSLVCNWQILFERSVVGLLRLANVLMSLEDMRPEVMQILCKLLLLKPQILCHVSRQIAFGMFKIIKENIYRIHSGNDWKVLIQVLECVGAGAHPPCIVGEVGKPVIGQVSDEDSYCYGPARDEEIAASGQISPEIPPKSPLGLILLTVSKKSKIQPLQIHPVMSFQFSFVHRCELLSHDPQAFIKTCECLDFLVNEYASITPHNFESCVHCLRTLVEAILKGSERKDARSSHTYRDPKRKRDDFNQSKSFSSCSSSNYSYDADESETEELPLSSYAPVKVLELMHTLHRKVTKIFPWCTGNQKADPNSRKEWVKPSLWFTAWCPLVQGIARLCCDYRYPVCMQAIFYLQNSLMYITNLSAKEWESCFNDVLFPLITTLLEPLPHNINGLDEVQLRAVTLLSKIFLRELRKMTHFPKLTNLWLTILDFMEKCFNAKSDILYDAVPESLKNMLLAMYSAKVFTTGDGYSPLWTTTWDRINLFLPSLKDEIVYLIGNA